MLIIKPVIICIIALILIILLKNISPEFAAMVAIICGLIIIFYIIPYIKRMIDVFMPFFTKLGNEKRIIKMIVQVIAVSLICEFATQLCSDSQADYLSSKINFAGKIIILSIVSPSVISFFEYLIELINAL